MIASGGKPPAAVARGRRLAQALLGRELLFKTNSYMGPVHVEQARCTYRWFYLTLATHPWRQGEPTQWLDWQAPPSSVTEYPTRVVIRAYDVVGMLIHDCKRIRDIEQLRREGAGVKDLLRAFNAKEWPTAEFHAPK